VASSSSIPGNPVTFDIGNGLSVDAGRAAIAAHQLPRALQHVSAVDLVMERIEPSPGIGFGRPVQRALQVSDPVCFSGPSHLRHSPALPRTSRMNEAAALPSPTVALSARLKQYYGRLRRPPGTGHFPTHAGYRPRRSDPRTSAGGRAGEGLPSSRHHHPNVPHPLRRGVHRGRNSRIFTPSMAFTQRDEARLSHLHIHDAAGFA
jgi:hypothetical protein